MYKCAQCVFVGVRVGAKVPKVLNLRTSQRIKYTTRAVISGASELVGQGRRAPDQYSGEKNY